MAALAQPYRGMQVLGVVVCTNVSHSTRYEELGVVSCGRARANGMAE